MTDAETFADALLAYPDQPAIDTVAKCFEAGVAEARTKSTKAFVVHMKVEGPEELKRYREAAVYFVTHLVKGVRRWWGHKDALGVRQTADSIVIEAKIGGSA